MLFYIRQRWKNHQRSKLKMTLEKVQSIMAKVQKGRITPIHYQTIKGDYTKETQTRVRFVPYANIKGVEVKGKSNPNETKDSTNEFIIYNSKTNKYYLQIATIKTKGKAKVKYYYQGKEITKAEYDLANPPRPNTQPLVVFRKDIADIISIG